MAAVWLTLLVALSALDYAILKPMLFPRMKIGRVPVVLYDVPVATFDPRGLS